MQVIARVTRIVEGAYPLRGIDQDHKNKLKNAIWAHGYNKGLCFLMITPKGNVTNVIGLDVFTEDEKGIKMLKPK